MTRRIFWLAATFLVAAILVYLSRFWLYQLWGREGLFGIGEVPPQGGLLGFWLRGTILAPFELILWTIGGFLALGGMERLYSYLTRGGG